MPEAGGENVEDYFLPLRNAGLIRLSREDRGYRFSNRIVARFFHPRAMQDLIAENPWPQPARE